MTKDYTSDIIGLEIILNRINRDLAVRNKYNLEHLILRFSNYLSKDISIERSKLSDAILFKVSEYLSQNSETYREICNSPKNFLIFSRFLKFLLSKYDSLMITEKEIFDSNVYRASGQDGLANQELKRFGKKPKDVNDVQYTIELLNEAIRIYFELYNKRTLIALFSNDEIMKFKLEEATLAHILGISLEKIVTNDKLVDLFKITSSEKEAILNHSPGSAPIDVLLKIVDISNGNLLSYEEDRVRRLKLDRLQKFLSDDEYILTTHEKSEKPSALNYSKVNMRSKTFIDFKPLDEISLSIRFPKGYKLIRMGKDDVNHSILISKNNLSSMFKYSTFVTDLDEPNERRYFKSLEARTKDDVSTWKKDGELAISTQVISDPDPGTSGAAYVTIFSEEKQKQFIQEFLQDFYNVEDFEGLKEIQEYMDYLDKKAKTR